MEDLIPNRVASSTLVQIDLEDWYDHRNRHFFDVGEFLFEGLILKELDFRAALKAFDWEKFRDGHLAIGCTADAIVPTWAFMLVATYASPFAASITFGTKNQIDDVLFDRWIQQLDPEKFRSQKVIVKGCSKYPVPLSAYVAITAKLGPLVQSLMFGEACSNVPLFKRKKETPTTA
jgi:hypothetical protein